jgi:hypothetical protein
VVVDVSEGGMGWVRYKRVAVTPSVDNNNKLLFSIHFWSIWAWTSTAMAYLNLPGVTRFVHWAGGSVCQSYKKVLSGGG